MGGDGEEEAAPVDTAGAAASAPASLATTSPALTRAPSNKAIEALRAGLLTVDYQAYDFRRPDKFSKDQMRTLQMLHETFGRM